MKTPRRPRLSSLAAAAFGTLALSSAPALAADLALQPRYRAGDSYSLSLRADRDTDASWRSRTRSSFEESLRLDYTATVVVLEADEAGRPLRERHENVRLSATRPDGSASLFRDGARLEVRRDGDDVQVFAGDERLDRKTETIVTSLLETQFERGVGPALFDPGRAVEVGESWALDPSLARRFLREHGVRAVKLDGAPTATLAASGAEGELVIRYAIPVAWFEADGLPAHARATASDARLEGEIPLAADGGVTGHEAKLALHMNGVVHAPGFAYATPWRFTSARQSDERTTTLRRSYAAGS